VNPEVETIQDYRLLRQTLREIYRLGLAFQLTRNETYAAKATDRLYEWFVNPETKMNPHFHWGSLRKGNTHGSRTGILDMYPIYRVKSRCTKEEKNETMNEQTTFLFIFLLRSSIRSFKSFLICKNLLLISQSYMMPLFPGSQTTGNG
jgi:hypothetical protein